MVRKLTRKSFYGLKTPLILVLALLFLAACGQQGGPIISADENNTDTQNPAGEYEIFSRVDSSHKATTKPISGYTEKELAALPNAKQIVYKIVVSDTFKAEQAQATIDKFIAEMTTKDQDIDEIKVFLYSEKSRVDGAYDIAMAIWAPRGILEKVSPQVARGNKRDEYETKSHIRKNLEEYLSRRGKFQHNEMDDLTDRDQEDIDRLLDGIENGPATSQVVPLR